MVPDVTHRYHTTHFPQILLRTWHLTEERSLSQRSMWLRYLSREILVTLVRVWAMKRTRWDSIFLNFTLRLKVVHRNGSVPSWWSLRLTLATLFRSCIKHCGICSLLKIISLWVRYERIFSRSSEGSSARDSPMPVLPPMVRQRLTQDLVMITLVTLHNRNNKYSAPPLAHSIVHWLSSYFWARQPPATN